MLAVYERREAIACVALDTLPDIQHRAAGRVDHDAAESTKRLEVAHGHTERRQDNDVTWRNIVVVEHWLSVRVVARREDLDAHLAEAAVYVRVVDDLANEPDAPIGEFAARLVGVLDRSLDPITEA